jgi:dTDP-4-dehydrorhamnose 3,5-epimerase
MEKIGIIEGVKITPKRKIIDDRGAIFHMLRNNDPEFQKFGEIYFSKIHPGVVKAWHHHSRMTLNYMVVTGSIQLGLWDGRKGSKTFGVTQTVYLDEQYSQLVTVPHGVWNGFKGLGVASSVLANCATEPHDPEEITRRPFDDREIGYSWELKNG